MLVGNGVNIYDDMVRWGTLWRTSRRLPRAWHWCNHNLLRCLLQHASSQINDTCPGCCKTLKQWQISGQPVIRRGPSICGIKSLSSINMASSQSEARDEAPDQWEGRQVRWQQPRSGDNVKWTRIFPGFSVSISGVILSAGGALCWSKTEETEEESTDKKWRRIV